ncbi:MerR family transcriptional regulator [Bordetella genomosp. 13]|uniref:MerR family transcriptional regulator n=1 Tax=Bordetella genomosp. 13 TaxID=463040 RepID=UPI0011A34242|nr:MerR family DNA-binding transcriptional regulator [Bordetella genomosp. 13]
MPPSTWTISELAREFAITPRTIRFYEDQGIVSPARDGRNRVYGTRDRTRLKLALRGKRLGLQLSEIRSLIDMYESPVDTEPQLREYLNVLARHRAQLEQQRQDIDETLQEIESQELNCQELLTYKRTIP